MIFKYTHLRLSGPTNFSRRGERGFGLRPQPLSPRKTIYTKLFTLPRYKAILGNLHALGVCLWYKDIEEYNTLVLNPEWISEGIYKIINWAKNVDKYCISLNDFSEIFQQILKRYPVAKHSFLFELMIRYELAFATIEGKELVIPHLLQEDRPEDLLDFPVGDSLMLRYKAEQPLPPNTISRFIVRHNQEIKKEKKKPLVWRIGVVLDDGSGSIALVREEDRTISVAVKGKSKTDYISKLRQTLEDIFKSYKSDKPELQYKIERSGNWEVNIERDKQLWLPESKIVKHYERSKPYYDEETDREIPMEPVVNIYHIHCDKFMFQQGSGEMTFDNSTHKVLNFFDCNIRLQGSLIHLARFLNDNGNVKEAKILTDAAKLLEKVEEENDPIEVKKKGIISRLKRIVEELQDEKSTLHNKVMGVKNGIKIAEDIFKEYENIAFFDSYNSEKPDLQNRFDSHGEAITDHEIEDTRDEWLEYKKNSDFFLARKIPYYYGTYIRDRTKFFGRKEEIGDIINLLRQAENENYWHIAVIGDYRSGKSSLLKILEDEIQLELSSVSVYIDLSTVSESNFFERIISSVGEAVFAKSNDNSLIKKFKEIIDTRKYEVLKTIGFEVDILNVLKLKSEPQNDNSWQLFGNALNALYERLREFGVFESVVIIVDEVSAVTTWENKANILKMWRGLIQNINGYSFIVGSAYPLYQLAKDEWSPFFNIFKSTKVSSLKKTEAEELIILPAESVGLLFRKKMVDYIQDFTSNKPYYIQAFCASLCERLLKMGPSIKVDQDFIELCVDQTISYLGDHFLSLWEKATCFQKKLLLDLVNNENNEQEINFSDFKFEEKKHLNLLEERSLIKRNGNKIQVCGILEKWISKHM